VRYTGEKNDCQRFEFERSDAAIIRRAAARVSAAIAAPSILAFYGLAGATFIVAAQIAHWFGPTDPDSVTFNATVLLGL
jgi:hypothetical protein